MNFSVFVNLKPYQHLTISGKGQTIRPVNVLLYKISEWKPVAKALCRNAGAA